VVRCRLRFTEGARRKSSTKQVAADGASSERDRQAEIDRHWHLSGNRSAPRPVYGDRFDGNAGHARSSRFMRSLYAASAVE
jgi:hypothetical protein